MHLEFAVYLPWVCPCLPGGNSSPLGAIPPPPPPWRCPANHVTRLRHGPNNAMTHPPFSRSLFESGGRGRNPRLRDLL